MWHVGQVPGSEEMTSGCIGHTYVVATCVGVCGVALALALASGGTLPSAARGLDGFVSGAAGGAPGEHAARSAVAKAIR